MASGSSSRRHGPNSPRTRTSSRDPAFVITPNARDVGNSCIYRYPARMWWHLEWLAEAAEAWAAQNCAVGERLDDWIQRNYGIEVALHDGSVTERALRSTGGSTHASRTSRSMTTQGPTSAAASTSIHQRRVELHRRPHRAAPVVPRQEARKEVASAMRRRSFARQRDRRPWRRLPPVPRRGEDRLLAVIGACGLAIGWCPAAASAPTWWRGLLLTSVVPDAESAQTLGFTVFFPLMFLSAVFVPVGGLPDGVSEYNPVSALAVAVRAPARPAGRARVRLIACPHPVAASLAWISALLLCLRSPCRAPLPGACRTPERPRVAAMRRDSVSR